MHKNTKKGILNAIYDFGNIDSYILLSEFNRNENSPGFDNTVMRYVRRLAEKSYLKRTGRGTYKLTARGRKYIEKTI